MKKFYSIFLLLILLMCLIGCDEKEDPNFEMGFDSKIPGDKGHSSFLTGVKSDKRIFDKNDVTLDFYFGYPKNYKCPPDEWYDGQFKFICYATYFYVNGEVVNNYIGSFKDYKNIEGFHLIREYSKEEFLVEEKKAVYYPSKIFMFSGKVEFNYYETLTIPSYLFDSYDDVPYEKLIYFGVFEVIQNLETGEYWFLDNPSGTFFIRRLKLKFEKKDNNKIKILNGLY